MTGCVLSETQATIAMVMGMLPATVAGLVVFGRSLYSANLPASRSRDSFGLTYKPSSLIALRLARM